MRLVLLIAGLLLALMGLAAEARVHAPYRGHRIVPAASAELPLDGFTTATVAVSFRKLRTAYAGPAIRIRRASDNAELDIGFLGFVPGLGAPWNEAAAVSHCAATTCFGRTWYSQEPAARNLEQSTPANQMQLVFNCNGALPCWRSVASEAFSASSFTPSTGVMSLSVVANRAVGTGACQWLRPATPNRMYAFSGTTSWQLVSTGTISTAVSDAVWHAAIGVINGAASVFAVDGVETTGTITGSVAPAVINLLGAAATTCQWEEAISWDAYALTAGERTAWRANQKSFWGTP